MVRGQADYGITAPTEQYATLADLAEVVRRLTGLIYSDGRGATVFHDDFEGTILKWGFRRTNAATIALDSTYAKSGSQSVKLDTAKVLIAAAGIWREFGIQLSQRLGTEISFCKPDAHTSFTIQLGYYNGTTAYSAEAKIDFSNKQLSIRTGALTWEVVATLDAFSASEQAFHPFKLVVDFNTKKYQRVMIDGACYTFDTYSPYSYASALNPRVVSQFLLEGLDTTGGALWLDDAIFTQEEP